MKMDIVEFVELLKHHIGKPVRFRVEGISAYTDDKLAGFEVDGTNVKIVMEQNEVTTFGVNEISSTPQIERVDVWLCGEKVNRFNYYH